MDGAYPVGEQVFAVGVAHGQHRDVFDAMTIRIGDRGLRERLVGLGQAGEFVFPAVAGTDDLARVDITGPVGGERGASAGSC